MKNKIKSIVLTLIMVGIVSIVNAQHDHKSGEGHEHNTPHGGVVISADNQHIELVRGIDKNANPVFTFYLLDSEKKTLPNTGKRGLLLYQTTEGMTEQVNLILSGDDKFVYTGAKGISYTNLIVSLKEGEKAATAKFVVGTSAAPTKKKETEHNDRHNHHH